MSKKKRKKLSKLTKMRIARDAYRGMMGYWKEQARALRTEGAMYALVLDGAELELQDAIRWSAAWKAAAKQYRGLQVHSNQRMANLEEDYSHQQRRVDELKDMLVAKNGQISDIEHAKDVWAGRFFALVAGPIDKANTQAQCPHPAQAIRSGRDVVGPDGAVSHWCGWCEEVGHEQALNRVLTEQLIGYRAEVARLREADMPDVTEHGGEWDYNMAMELYNEQQKRAREAEAREAQLREALEAQALRDDIKSEWYRQSDLGKPPSDERWASIGYEHVAGARRQAIILRQAALSTPADDWLAQHDAEVRREYLRSLCEPDIMMTWVEYEIDPLQGWHGVCRDYKGTDEIAVKYFGDTAAIRKQEADDDNS